MPEWTLSGEWAVMLWKAGGLLYSRLWSGAWQCGFQEPMGPVEEEPFQVGLVSHNVLLIPEHELLCVVKSAHSSGCLEPALAISFRENLVSVPSTQRGKAN